jgi:hypothetical protein
MLMPKLISSSNVSFHLADLQRYAAQRGDSSVLPDVSPETRIFRDTLSILEGVEARHAMVMSMDGTAEDKLPASAETGEAKDGSVLLYLGKSVFGDYAGADSKGYLEFQEGNQTLKRLNCPDGTIEYHSCVGSRSVKIRQDPRGNFVFEDSYFDAGER